MKKDFADLYHRSGHQLQKKNLQNLIEFDSEHHLHPILAIPWYHELNNYLGEYNRGLIVLRLKNAYQINAQI